MVNSLLSVCLPINAVGDACPRNVKQFLILLRDFEHLFNVQNIVPHKCPGETPYKNDGVLVVPFRG